MTTTERAHRDLDQHSDAMTIPSDDYERGVINERERIGKRLRAAWRAWGTDGVLDLMDELETGIRSAAVDAALRRDQSQKP